jgi:hypothetical protein
MIQELEGNRGQMGLQYAQLLGRNPAKIDAWVYDVCKRFAVDVKAVKEERFWVALCGTLLAGAELANSLGATLDLEGMRRFLIGMYAANRRRLVEEAVEGGTMDNTMEALSGFLKRFIAETIWTDTFPMGKGKPPALTVPHGPPTNYPRPIQVQWALNDRLVRICKREFVAYLEWRKIPPRQVINGLVEHFGCVFGYSKIAAGTQYQSIQEQLMCLPVPPGSPLEEQMYAHSNAVDIGASAANALTEDDIHAEPGG